MQLHSFDFHSTKKSLLNTSLHRDSCNKSARQDIPRMRWPTLLLLLKLKNKLRNHEMFIAYGGCVLMLKNVGVFIKVLPESG